MSNLSRLNTVLDEIRATLRALPADSPDWEAVVGALDSFALDVNRIRENKGAERDALLRQREEEMAQRALLQLNLRQLGAIPATALDYFDLGESREWQPEQVATEQVGAVAKAVEELRNIVLSHARRRERAQQSLAERRRAEPELAQLETEFELLITFLRRTFAAPTSTVRRKPKAPSVGKPARPPGSIRVSEQASLTAARAEESGEQVTATAASIAPALDVHTTNAAPGPVVVLAEAQAAGAVAPEPDAAPDTAVVALAEAQPTAVVALEQFDATNAEAVAQPVIEPIGEHSSTPGEDEPAAPVSEPLAAVSGQFAREGIGQPTPPMQVTVALIADETEPDPSPTASTSPVWTIDAQSRLLWDRIQEGDLSGAYWIARSLTSRGESAPVAPELLAAVQGCLWLLHGRGVLFEDMLDLARTYELGGDRDERLLATAAALVPALLAPDSAFGSWLTADPRLPSAYNDIVEAVREFGYYGQPLRPELRHAMRSVEQRQEMLAEYQRQATRWLATAPKRRPGFQRAVDVWKYWTGANGPLRLMVEEVAAGNTRRTGRLEELLDEWRQRSIQKWVDLTDHQRSGRAPGHSRRIDGKVRDYLHNYADEVVELTEGWLALAHAESPQASETVRRVEHLVKLVDTQRSEALADLGLLAAASSPPAPAPLLRVALWSLQALLSFLELEELPVDLQPVAFPAGIEPPSLYGGLRYRLLLTPEVGLVEDPRDDPTALPDVAMILNAAAGRGLVEAFDLFLAQADYRFCQTLIDNMPSGPAAACATRLAEARAHSQRYLDDRYHRLSNATEQAVVDGLLDEAERAELVDQLETVRQSRSADYRTLDRRLASVQSLLEEARAQRIRIQQDRWSRIKTQLEETGFVKTQAAVYGEMAAFVEDLLQRQDVVVMDERLARLEELLDRGEVPTLAEFVTPPPVDVYREFIDALERWERDNPQELFRTADLLGNVRRSQPKTIATLQIGGLPQPRRLEFEKALESWRWLKQERQSQGRDRLIHHVAVLLRDFLGFTMARPTLSEVVSWREHTSDLVHLTFAMRLGDLSPLPQFGSMHGDSYDVVVLWERPSAETIGARLDSLKLRPHNILVIFLGDLGTRRRLDQLHYNRQKPQSVAILDHYLLLYLARLEGARLPVFFRCALPLARINPYSETGPVAVEMFKGREAEVADLMNPTGFSLVYGGRQLGKSALFQAVQRQFHKPEADRYVLLEDIKTVGDQVSQTPDPAQIWERLRAGLNRLNLLPKSTAKLDPGALVAQISEMMEAHPNRRVLVLFDEADKFLTADQTRNFELVSRLKALMDETRRRFKIIFAGLHNVQRYVNVANQPLAHLRPLQIEPLKPDAARRLIVEPLEALGFRFRDETPILGILAYSNSHPGLIQLLCHRLLEMLYQRPPTQLAPYLISREDIEAVYRQREVQEGIRLRFEWTLALDPRYKALAEIMVLEQLQDRDSFARAFGAPEMRELSLGYWRQAFEKTDLSEFRSYLNEMVGLGVLVRTQAETYRLRSPNLVRLMGSPEDILASLGDLADKAVAPAFEPDSHRAALDAAMRRYSPFTFAQERLLMAQELGVGLVFGSRALGVDSVTEAIRRAFADNERAREREIRVPAPGGEALRLWLEQVFERDVEDNKGLLVYRRLGYDVGREEMVAQVQAALSFVRRHRRAQRRWLRILFIFDEVATLEWLRLAPVERQSLEEEAVSAAVALSRWNRVGVEQRLHQHGKMAVERVVQRIQDAFEGWPCLLDRLADTWDSAPSDDPLLHFDAIRVQLESGPLRDEFLKEAGVDVEPSVRRVLEAIVRYETVPLADALPSVLDERLTEEECAVCIRYLERLRLIAVDGDVLRPNGIIARLLSPP